MIQSMTGYGKADVIYNGKKIHVEIKSLNSKSLDLSTRLAPLYREKEMELRKLIQERLERGKVEFTLWIEKDVTTTGGVINADAVANYVAQMEKISVDVPALQLSPERIWETLVRLPEVVQTSSIEVLEEEEWTNVYQGIEEAISNLIDFRKQEGEALYAKFCGNLQKIEQLMHDLEPYEQSRVEKVRQRLTERLAELKGVDYDKGRLEQELIYYIAKRDINEEKQRLTNHLEYFKQTMLNGCGQGKKLGLIAQELAREINTTRPKST